MELIINNIWLILGIAVAVAALAINYNCLDEDGEIRNE